MAYYIPLRYFSVEEIFSPYVVSLHTRANSVDDQIWRLMDDRILRTIVDMRSHFGVPFYINDYLFGGDMKQRGYRHFLELVDITTLNNMLQSDKISSIDQIKSTFSSFTSQHCHGRAIDFTVQGFSAEEIRQDIKNNKTATRYKYIAAVENNVSWVHIDCRPWQGERLFFGD